MKTGVKQVLCVCGGVVCSLCVQWVSGVTDLGKAGYLPRNAYGEGESGYDLVVSGLLDEDCPITVTLGERMYTQEEAVKIFFDVIDNMGEKVLGSNKSFSEVRSDLNLVTWLPDEGVKLRWGSESPDIIDSFGHIRGTKIPKSGISTWLTVHLMLGMYSEEYAIPIQVYPPVLSKQEADVAGLMEQIEALDRMQQTEDGLRLPVEYEGKLLHYREGGEVYSGLLVLLGVVLAVILYVRDKRAVEEEKKRRGQELMADYAEIVFKLTVFIGAGMTVLNAWERLVLDYQDRLKQGRTRPRAAYEEMYTTLHQITCGVSEGQAYISFGKRCQLQPYLKLSSLLEQNRKTGTKNLNSLLEEEMRHAWEQRKTMAKRLGEEAGTKLLIPLFLMLGIVMVIVMVPAMMSMM